MPATIKIRPGRVPPKDMNDREWARFASGAEADHIKSGQTDYDTGTGFFLGDHQGVPKLSIGDSANNKITWDGATLVVVGDITVEDGSITADKMDVSELSAISADMGEITAGSIVLPSGGFIRSGQTAYDTGTGFYLGNDSGTPRLSIGNSAGNKLTWNGTTLSISGAIDLSNTIQTFTPTWLDFSSDPSGTISYMDLGRIVMMWRDTSLTGTSDDVFMRWDVGSVPAAIRPSANRLINADVIDNVTQLKGSVIIHANGGATFSIVQTSGVQLVDVGNNFSSPGVPKGIPAGWLIIYPK
jgi:hypothetical protein